MVKKVPQVKTRTDFVHLFEALCGGDLDPIRHLFDNIINFSQLARTNWHKSEAWAKFFLSDKTEYWEQLSRTPEKDQMPTPTMDRFESSSSSTKRNKPSSRLLSKDWVLNAFLLATGLKLKLKIPVPDREANPKRKSKRKLQEEPFSSDDELSITREDIFPPNPKHQKLQFDLTNDDE